MMSFFRRIFGKKTPKKKITHNGSRYTYDSSRKRYVNDDNSIDTIAVLAVQGILSDSGDSDSSWTGGDGGTFSGGGASGSYSNDD